MPAIDVHFSVSKQTRLLVCGEFHNIFQENRSCAKLSSYFVLNSR